MGMKPCCILEYMVVLVKLEAAFVLRLIVPQVPTTTTSDDKPTTLRSITLVGPTELEILQLFPSVDV